MPKDEKGKVTSLSLEESKRVKGSAAELAAIEKAKTKKAEEAKLVSAEDVKATKEETPQRKPKKKKLVKNKGASVVRNPKTGRAEKPKPVLLGAAVTKTPDPVIKKFRKGQLVTIKPRKRKKQTPIAVPKPGQAGKLGGETVRVTPDNVTQIYEEKRRTDLPKADADVMTPASRPEVEGAIMPGKLRGSQNKKNLGGFAAKHSVVSSVAHEALGHLQTMAEHEPGTPQHHVALEAFNQLHGQLGQISNKDFHKTMGLGRTIVQQHRGPNMANALKIHRGVMLGKLEEGRIAEQSRGDRTGPKKEGQ